MHVAQVFVVQWAGLGTLLSCIPNPTHKMHLYTDIVASAEGEYIKKQALFQASLIALRKCFIILEKLDLHNAFIEIEREQQEIRHKQMQNNISTFV